MFSFTFFPFFFMFISFKSFWFNLKIRIRESGEAELWIRIRNLVLWSEPDQSFTHQPKQKSSGKRLKPENSRLFLADAPMKFFFFFNFYPLSEPSLDTQSKIILDILL